MSDIVTLLDTLAARHVQYEGVMAARAAAVPQQVWRSLAQVEARFAPELMALEQDLKRLTTDVKAAVLAHGASVKGARLHAVYTAGRPRWEDTALLGYAVEHPALLALRTLGAPSVSLRTVQETEPRSPAGAWQEGTTWPGI